ncbi:MAG: hypothetical protein ACHQXL_09575, partial [Candidatus Limnocylindrales bacterium]
MADGGSFYSAPPVGGRHRDWRAAAAVVLVVVGIAVAIAKPWGGTGSPAASGRPGVAAVSPPPAASPTPAQPASPALPTALAYPLPVAFTTAPPPASGAWAALAWQKLAPDDPFGAVRIELTSGQTSLAVGDLQGTTSSTIWASTDQTHWQPTDSGALTTLPSGLTVIGLASLTGRFVAVTELNDYLYRYLPPVMSWTLTDGRNWTHAATLPADVITGPAGSPLLVATGPAGLVVA